MDPTDMHTANQDLLRQFIAGESEALLGTLRYYVVRAGLADGRDAAPVAIELLNEVVVQALEHADRFRPSGQPMAWLLGIAANLIRRRQAERATRDRREPLVRDLCSSAQDGVSEDELFDRVASLAAGGPIADWEANEAASAILAHVSANDRRVLRLAVLHDLNGEGLAQELGIKPGAARVRLHRALNRLREAWPGWPKDGCDE
jgi:RNA polymerase sigma factor (sigma-70 family)